MTMDSQSIQDAPRAPELRQTILPEYSQATPSEDIITPTPGTPRAKRKSNDEVEIDNKKFCHKGGNKEIVSQLIALTNMFQNFQTDVLSRLTGIEEDVQLIKQNTLLAAEPVDNVEKLDALTETVNEIRDQIQSGPLPSQDRISQRVQFNPPTLDAGGEYKRKLELNKRKSAYYNQINAEDRCEILKAQSSEEPPSVPARYLPTYMENEHAEDLAVRRELCRAIIDCDIKSLQNKSLRSKTEVEEIDKKVIEEISNDIGLTEEEKEWQIREWNNKVQLEEKKSAEIWRKKHDNIVSLPDNQKASGKIIDVNGILFASSSKRKKSDNADEAENNVADSSANPNWRNNPNFNQRNHYNNTQGNQRFLGGQNQPPRGRRKNWRQQQSKNRTQESANTGQYRQQKGRWSKRAQSRNTNYGSTQSW